MDLTIISGSDLEARHDRLHTRGIEKPEICQEIQIEHDLIAAELVRRGGPKHETPFVCSIPDYGAGDDMAQCANCIFAHPKNFCSLYNFNFIPTYRCDSWNPISIMALEHPHGFLIWKGKQTAIASDKAYEKLGPYLIVSRGEAFGIATLSEPAEMNTGAFETKSWADQHCILPRERRQYWPEAEKIFVHTLEEWEPFDSPLAFEDGRIQEPPAITGKQKQLIAVSQDLPKQIPLIDEAVVINDLGKVYWRDGGSLGGDKLKEILSATYERDIDFVDQDIKGLPIYSLALVRSPRMLPRTPKKKINQIKQLEADMPWEIQERDGEFCVVKIDDGDVEGCHDTEAEAENQIIALNISEFGDDAERRKKPKSRPKTEGVPYKEKAEIEPASLKDRVKSAISNLLDFFVSRGEDEPGSEFESPCGISQKNVNGEIWHFSWSANAFRDRDGEIFSTKGLETYVASNEENESKGFFNLWHINPDNTGLNSDFAVKEWQGVIGRFLVEAGPYTKDNRGESAKKFFGEYPQGHPDLAPEGWGASVEFKYLPEERKTTVFDNFWINKTSVLPRLEAANVWTDSYQNEVKDMALTEKQKAAYITLFGEQDLEDLQQNAKERTEELESAADFKDNSQGESPPDEKPEPEEAPEPEPASTGIDYDALGEVLMKQFEINLAPLAKDIEAIKENLASQQERIAKIEGQKAVEKRTETPRYMLSLQRASEAESTEAEKELSSQKPKETTSGKQDTWGQMFGNN